MIQPVTLASGEGEATLQAYGFRAMGTSMELLLDAEPTSAGARLLREAEREVRRLESLLSRFLPTSELSRLNREGRLVAGEDLLQVVELALLARESTGGRFDPTVHDALVAEGYDRTFDDVPQARPAEARFRGCPCAGEVVVDRRRRLIELEPGYRLDLGGIGKGYAVDRAAAILAEAGRCLVNGGGDLAVQGPGLGAWPVGVETPSGSVTLLLRHGGLATSGADRRTWRVGRQRRHHLIDPRTGRSARSDLLRVTVVGGSAVDAEVQAKALFLAGESSAVAEADALALPCLLVTMDRRTVQCGGLA